MEEFRLFLKSSTIHGLSYIPSTRKCVRYAWILVVIGGFTGAGFLIHQSFENWYQSPVTTTLKTKPISKVTFPKVAVCPKKNIYTNLNYDLMTSTRLILTENTRKELINYAMEVSQDIFYHEIMKNLSKLDDSNRFYDWYHGYSSLVYPYFRIGSDEVNDIYSKVLQIGLSKANSSLKDIIDLCTQLGT